MKKGTSTIIAIALISVVVMSGFGVFAPWGLPAWLPINQQPTQQTQSGTGSGTGGSPTTYSGILYLEVVDSVLGTGITTSTTTVDVVAAQNGQFDFISGPKDTKAQAANPQAMNSIWAEGTELIIMPDCTGNPTNGLDYYPAMYYVKLGDGAQIYELNSPSCFQQVSSSPYKYSVNPAAGKMLSQRVAKYESSSVYYWNLGKIFLYPRQAAADVDIYLMYSGTELSKCTDASTWDDDTTDMDANATLASDTETIHFQMVGANANVGWGKHFFAVSQQGKVEEYGAVIVVSTAMTAIKVPSGWNSITMSTLYAEKAFYKVLDAERADPDVQGTMFPAKGNKPSWTVDIDIDATSAAASTAFLLKFWIEDCQKLSDVPVVGTSTGVPGAYGFATSYGVGAVVHNTALTVSSGAGETEQLCTYLTTAA